MSVSAFCSASRSRGCHAAAAEGWRTRPREPGSSLRGLSEDTVSKNLFFFSLQLGKFHAARPWLRAQDPSHTPLKNSFSNAYYFFFLEGKGICLKSLRLCNTITAAWPRVSLPAWPCPLAVTKAPPRNKKSHSSMDLPQSTGSPPRPAPGRFPQLLSLASGILYMYCASKGENNQESLHFLKFCRDFHPSTYKEGNDALSL